MQPTINIVEEKILIGMRTTMSLLNINTYQLFSTFMPRRKEIGNCLDGFTFDLRIYPEDYFLDFDPARSFVKWALAEVSNADSIPKGMDLFLLTGGQYATFISNDEYSDSNLFQYIFRKWLPSSIYQLDNRPHFEILEDRTKPADRSSVDEVWIPIKLKK